MSPQAKSQTIAPGSTRFTAALERRVLDQIRKSRIFTPGEHVLVGVSGGPDSTALLSILSRLRPQLQIARTAGPSRSIAETPSVTLASSVPSRAPTRPTLFPSQPPIACGVN